MTQVTVYPKSGQASWVSAFAGSGVRWLGVAVTLLSIAVLIGWHLRLPILVQVRPDFVPMQYNTALGFLLSGGALLLAQGGRSRAAGVCGGLAAALGSLTLVQYQFAVDLGIDTALHDPFVTVKTADPGRMSPPTAFCFLLGGLAVVALRRRAGILSAFLSVGIIAVAVTTLVGYGAGFETPFGWQAATYMAVHTATGFLLLGVGLFTLAARRRIEQGGALNSLFTLGSAVVVATLAWALSQAVQANEEAAIRARVAQRTASIAEAAGGAVRSNLLALVRMAHRWDARGGTPRVEWEADATQAIAHQPVLRSIWWADAALIRRWVVPLNGNEAQVGTAFQMQERTQALAALREGLEVAIVLSDDSRRTQETFYAFLPVAGDPSGKAAGFIVGVLDYDALLRPFLSTADAPAHGASLFHGQREVYRRVAADAGDPWSASRPIDIGDLTLRLEVRPAAALVDSLRSPLAWVVLGIGLLLALTVALTVHFGQRAANNAAEARSVVHLLEAEVAERGRAEAKVRQRTAELESVNQDLEAFSYSVSHDLRAPLRHLAGFVELLHQQTGLSLDSKTRHYLDVIHSAATKMAQLIDDLLHFSRTSRAEMRTTRVDLGRLVHEVIDELRQQTIGRQIEWRVSPLPMVEADPNLLRIVLANLLGNAVKFTRQREWALIAVGIDEERSEGSLEWVFFVRDNGAGFDPQYGEKLFDVFQRLHSSQEFEGTGIGLATVRRLIERHGGRVFAEGKVEAGATLFFTLPRPGATAPPPVSISGGGVERLERW